MTAKDEIKFKIYIKYALKLTISQVKLIIKNELK